MEEGDDGTTGEFVSVTARYGQMVVVLGAKWRVGGENNNLILIDASLNCIKFERKLLVYDFK